MKKEYLLIGASYMLLSALAYAALSAIAKEYNTVVSVPVIIFLQNAVALILLLGWIIGRHRTHRTSTLSSRNKRLQFMRTIFSMCITYFFYFSLQYSSLVESSLLLNTAPLLAPFLNYLLFNKKIQHRLWPPMIVGFIGVIIVLHPSTHRFHAGSLLALCAALSMALSGICVRRAQERGDSGFTTFFYYFIYATPISAVIALPFWQTLPWEAVMMIIISGVLWFTVQYTFSMGLMHLEAHIALSLYYANIIFAALLGIVLWKYYPTTSMWLGVLLIIVGGIFTLRQQHRLTRSRT